MFVDVFSNILIITPLMLPLLAATGVSQLHYGIITAVNSTWATSPRPLPESLHSQRGL